MKFVDILEYQEMKPLIDEVHGTIKSKEDYPCSVCGELTTFIDLCFEAPFCSEECLEEFYRQYWEAEGYISHSDSWW